jgi:hypothetical protein
MIFGAFLFSGILVAAFGWQLNRARRRAAPRRWRRRLFAGLAVSCGLVATLCFACGACAYWYTHRTPPPPLRRDLFRGVEYVRDVRRSPRPMVIHLVRVDLRAPGIAFLVTPPGGAADGHVMRARKTSTFLAEFGVQVAINANYFYPFRSESPWDYYPHEGDGVDVCGYAASRGQVYSDKRWRDGTLFISADNRASFEEPAGGGPVFNAIAGNGFLMRHGAVVPPPADEDKPYPRAALGLDASGERMLLLIVDGKQPGYSEGATLTELAAIARQFGGHDVIRLDEGGSCALAVEGRHSGQASLLNVPINNRVPYRERVVANHLGVSAQRLP